MTLIEAVGCELIHNRDRGLREYSPHLRHRVMALIRSHRLNTWDICSWDRESRQSRFRLRRYPRSPCIDVRELVQGMQVTAAVSCRPIALANQERRSDPQGLLDALEGDSTDEDLQHWLDRLEPFHQWVFGCNATYGLRPREPWHAEGIDSQAWISIPGDMKTKTAEHFAPAVPEAWVERLSRAQAAPPIRRAEPSSPRPAPAPWRIHGCCS